MDITVPYPVIWCFVVYTYLISTSLLTKESLSDKKHKLIFTLLLLTSWFSEIINAIGVFSALVIASASIHTKSKSKFISTISWTTLILGSLGLSLHIIPGFNNTLVFPESHLGSSTLPYKLYANMDKAIAAYLLLNAFIEKVKFPSAKYLVKEFPPSSIIALIIIFSVGLFYGVNFEFKYGELLLAFSYFNLFVTCISEETFFRFVVQDSIAKIKQKILWKYFAATLSAIIFTLAHFHTGEGAVERLSLIFLAGIFYSIVYLRSGSLLIAIAAHFLVNIIHITFFTYPATFS